MNSISRASDRLPEGIMNSPNDIEAEVTFLPTAAGGRQGPAFSGYRPQFFYDGEDWVAIQFYPDVDQVNPGDTVRVCFAFLSPHMHVGKLVRGKMFLIREGQKVVAYGRVTKVLQLEESARRTRERGEK
jgi:translation elongation factor EF-Tu-like GTPase